MANEMTEEELLAQEKLNTGSSWTRNEVFDKNGFLVIKDLWDAKELYHSVPLLRGQYNFYGKNLEQFNYAETEGQVEGSTSRYWHPQYRAIHSGIRQKLEEIIGRKLYNTYYYDRFYFPGQELTKHVDRDACEISVSVHVSTNLEGADADWPFWIKTPDGEECSAILKAGDGLLYKGCERPHWREKMPGSKADNYYHQIFFHYVLQDGVRAQCAWDR